MHLFLNQKEQKCTVFVKKSTYNRKNTLKSPVFVQKHWKREEKNILEKTKIFPEKTPEKRAEKERKEKKKDKNEKNIKNENDFQF